MNVNPITVLFLYKPFERVKQHLLSHFKDFSHVKFVIPEDTSEEHLLTLIPEADVLIYWDTSEKILQAAKKLRLYISPYTGVEHLSRKLLNIQNLPKFTLCNAHGASGLIAQQTIAMLFAICNQIVYHHNDMANGNWIPGGEGVEEPAPSIKLAERKIGLLGYGQINQKVHQMLCGINENIHILKRSWTEKAKKSQKKVNCYNFEERDEFFQAIDILIIAAPLTKLTHQMITSRELKLLGKKGIIVNVGRADIIVEEDLFKSLQNGTIARAALDVWYRYRPESNEKGKKYPYTYPFHELSNVLISPHRADSPFDDLERWSDIIENIKILASGNSNFKNVVDITNGY
ncbi:NAD(P)-dependent oxidoreductase [Candidatus Lokiarchaeum ossiferum]|uniref:NAD(P)-dependent oxidoreductase n=1 Tax=Candidatus Lokiarchaeum ossiferum TaxID=2951803 RepID=UPI00352F3E92